MSLGGTDFVVKRDDLQTCEFVPGEDIESRLEPGQVQLRITKFALTANNITYAVYGESLGYWNFYPAEDGWGRVPVWGFGEVIRSANDAIQPGQRYYGFLPMSSYVTMQAKPNSAGFRDISTHRSSLPGAYNQYFLTANDPLYDPIHENEQMILRPLFITSFLAHDFLAHNDFFGARTILVSSASSKTAYGLAHLLSTGDPSIEVIGLTSAKNVPFTKGLGCYSSVFDYDEVDLLPREASVTYVDIAGNVLVRRAVRDRLKNGLLYSMAVGDTHWQQEKPRELLTDKQDFFFAPTWLTKRAEEWGMAGFEDRVAHAWHSSSAALSGWMK
ncbi:MAG: DUF2855 family protein, partial [Actinomycetota bacterium]